MFSDWIQTGRAEEIPGRHDKATSSTYGERTESTTRTGTAPGSSNDGICITMYSLQRVLKAIYWLLFGNAGQRRRIRQELARLSASLFGDYYISDDYKLWREDREFLKKYRELSPNNPYSQDRKFTLREFARLVKTVPGDMAECGCYEGASAWFMANELPEIPLHLFDSFSGLSEPGARDEAGPGVHFQWQSGDMSSSEDRIRQTLGKFSNTFIYKGWIPQRFSEIEGRKFRLVHIDVDLYEPTRNSLEFFYPRMSAGGVLVFDDYGVTSCPGAYRAVTDFMRDKKEHVLNLPTSQGVIIKE